MTSFLSALLVLLLPVSASAAESALSVHAKSIPNAMIPRGAQRADMLQLDLTASCDADVQINDVTLRHRGRGDTADITGVYAVSDHRRMSRAASFSSSDHTAVIRLRQYVVPRCGSRTLHIFADFSHLAATGGEHAITLKQDADITSTADNTILTHVESTNAVRTTPANTGTLEVSYPSQSSTVRYGTNQLIGRIALEADAQQDRAVTAITLTNDGTAKNTDLQTIYLESRDGRVRSTMAKELDGKTMRVRFDPPFKVEKNQRRTLDIRADVRVGRSKTIRMIIEEPSDIESTATQRGTRYQ